ncbi:MAG TPA: hypothetical protein VFS43_28765 [Polyangiaceae bacterium]|nr:hypothetical protein [Polyangiaceae bacterium]
MNRPALRPSAALLALGAAALTSLSGCYTTVVTSGKPAGPATVEYDEKWHHGAIYGIVEFSGPYDLQKACPNGWAEIETETSFLNGLVQGITYGIYNPQTVSVRCAVGAPPPPPAAAPPAPAAPPPAPAPAPPAEAPAKTM